VQGGKLMFKNRFKILLSLTVAAGFGVFAGCEDWESGDSFNTSQGAGAFVNFSGVYRPRTGAFLVGSNITQIVLTQVGNSLEVRDSNGSYYQGSVGSPGIVAPVDPVSGMYPAGATMLQGQVNFGGENSITRKNVSFVGIIHAVAVNDVTGFETGVDVSSSSDLDVSVVSGPATVTLNDSSNSTYVATHTYSVTAANTQYVLSGQWVEDSDVFTVEGIAAGLNGTFTP
jgi:hypothetical protein